MLTVRALEKRYAARKGETAGGVTGVSFEVAKGELFTLLGPSGCGKTTTLRSIAGLEQPDAGVIALDGVELFNGETGHVVPIYSRDIGMVFQSYAIWPHMSVFDNAAYPLRVVRQNRPSKSEITARVTRVLDMMGLGTFKDRSATQLSGGQQQRLALVRALVREPKLLLLDEPLSNLDAQLRELMRLELKRVQAEWGVTTVYVTHDQAEAMAISDRVAVMDQGQIVQVGPPADIYDVPRSEFVANFIGRTNMLRGRLTSAVGAGLTGLVETDVGAIRCRFPSRSAAGEDVSFVVRPENVTLSRGAEGPAGENHLDGEIASRVYLGDVAEFTVVVAGKYRILARAHPGIGMAPGERVRVGLPAEKTIAIQA